jgi:predicted CoA-substrate-specific enzyme activase
MDEIRRGGKRNGESLLSREDRMGLRIGLDIGTVSAKMAVIGAADRLESLTAGAAASTGGSAEPRTGPVNTTGGRAAGSGAEKGNGLLQEVFPHPEKRGDAIALSRYVRIQGRPLEAASALLTELFDLVGPEEVDSILATGSAGKLVGSSLGFPFENEFKTAAFGVGTLHADVENIFEMGGENSKYIRLSTERGMIGIVDYETNGDCAAGTGSFMDQQASRLRFDIEEVGDIVLATERTPKIAGRCSVFAKSDMIHAQQKGYRPGEVLKGLCAAVARNFKSNIARGKDVHGRTAFIGGVALNKGVAEALKATFDLGDGEFFVPERGVFMGAIGAALIAGGDGFDASGLARRVRTRASAARAKFPSWKPLGRDRVLFLRDRVDEFSFDGKDTPVDAYLGIDVGSVSTNLALIDDEGRVIKEIYLRTQARPIEVVHDGLQEIAREVGGRVRIRGVGTTGSGRELIGELIGADTINDEITAHKTGASFIGERLIGKKVDTIFEIGGQDSKYICIEDDIVVDFTMNEACAAGTGSFLEEQAEKLDVSIIDEFAERAFSSQTPLRLGERCTVYMEQDVSAYMKRGAEKNDIIGGLSYSVVQNYLNRVVRGRKIGKVIFFQGGTAYNDSVAAAFSEVLGKEIIVPPYNGVIGAIGSALLVREKVKALGIETAFRGYDLKSIDYRIREFTCSGCTNYCDIQEFTVEGDRTYWGDKCSDRYRKRAKVPKKAVVPDLFGLYRELIDRDWVPLVEERFSLRIDTSPPGDGAAPKIGYARSMYYYDRFPFWHTYLSSLGMTVVTSRPTNKTISHAGIEAAVAEPCFPIQVAHGHLVDLLESGVDRVLVPNVIDSETDNQEVNSYVCPWGQTLPFVLRRTPILEGREDFIAAPLVHFREGERFVERELWSFAREYGVDRRRHRRAVRAAYLAQGLFQEELIATGGKALEKLEESGEIGVILVGRPYNLMDPEVNLNVPTKLRDFYGTNVIPIFFLPLDGIGIRDINRNMFWNFGKKILQAARLAAQRDNLHLIYITNFKCGPDSYVKHYTSKAAERPYLTLQFDGHGNDAGIMTRCEAYLDSKGVLRWWKRKEETFRTGPSTYRECPTEELEASRRRSGTSA